MHGPSTMLYKMGIMWLTFWLMWGRLRGNDTMMGKWCILNWEWSYQCTKLELEDTHSTLGGGTDTRRYDESHNRENVVREITMQNQENSQQAYDEGTSWFKTTVYEPLRFDENDDKKGIISDPRTEGEQWKSMRISSYYGGSCMVNQW